MTLGTAAKTSLVGRLKTEASPSYRIIVSLLRVALFVRLGLELINY